ncbi:endonuclease/exonuclease/phosphatase family metal-dependent hydrolase [Neolewinella xylanilytica]|uniref:Endonuclease/exonuclease/phosphatase family metal-dependent hydrolase n=1 Tax=Neolewinella xylanilytica TaxID=1514080 RepID=A0A2S6IBC9_9BACT|nr:endonuclease/exonuclease/phosphatase family protein [Neolewinella xylanilytica]PPK88798.1 endonuclease/exonuclease/phosphatase family metal-dependent hydrolase [Neolewinella xylanilytica]
MKTSNILKWAALATLAGAIVACTPFRGAGDENPLTVMTYNIRYDSRDDGSNRWENRRDLLVSQVLFHQPDILGTQEVLSNQLDFLDRELRNYEYVGIGREGGNEGEFSALFYNDEKLRVEDSGTFWLSPTPGEVSTGWDAALPRIVTWARFRRLDTREYFMAFNTHFDHQGEEARLESARLLVSSISRMNTENLPVVVTGDLNLTPDTEAISVLTDYLEDAYAEADVRLGPVGTFTGFDYDAPAERRIDYVMVSEGIEVQRYAVLTDAVDRRFPSDHFPVVAKLVFP